MRGHHHISPEIDNTRSLFAFKLIKGNVHNHRMPTTPDIIPFDALASIRSFSFAKTCLWIYLQSVAADPSSTTYTHFPHQRHPFR